MSIPLLTSSLFHFYFCISNFAFCIVLHHFGAGLLVPSSFHAFRDTRNRCIRLAPKSAFLTQMSKISKREQLPRSLSATTRKVHRKLHRLPAKVPRKTLIHAQNGPSSHPSWRCHGCIAKGAKSPCGPSILNGMAHDVWCLNLPNVIGTRGLARVRSVRRRSPTSPQRLTEGLVPLTSKESNAPGLGTRTWTPFLHLAQQCAQHEPGPIRPMNHGRLPGKCRGRCKDRHRNPPEHPRIMQEQCTNHAQFVHLFSLPLGPISGRGLQDRKQNHPGAITVHRISANWSTPAMLQ